MQDQSTRYRLLFVGFSIIALFLVLFLVHKQGDASHGPTDQYSSREDQGGSVRHGGQLSSLDRSRAPDEQQIPAASSSPNGTVVQPSGLRRVSLSAHAADIRATAKNSSEPLSMDETGHYERVMVRLGEVVPVRIAFPNSQPGTKVAIQVEDGGNLVGGRVSEVRTLGEDLQVSFDFEIGHEVGIYRVGIRHKDSLAVLDFWAGDPLPLNEEMRELGRTN